MAQAYFCALKISGAGLSNSFHRSLRRTLVRQSIEQLRTTAQ
jgi:hypothetical protein